ncbi:MAG: hypothetical protein Q7R57_10600 [Dehalococcoidales bacterium]|nr:hypothetical protein [Dehalococcoidales bacterium]
MIRLLRTKGCKRCGGNLSLERDEYGAYVTCIQCGAVWNEVETASSAARPPERETIGAAKATRQR